MTTQGAVYIAVGDPRYFDEAVVSARSLRRAMPELPTLLYTNLPRTDPAFDEVVPVEDFRAGYSAKVDLLPRSPFGQTLYLDTDTFICGDISDVFTLLKRFDLLAARAPWRRGHPWIENGKKVIANVPAAFSELNGGVIAFTKCEATSSLLSTWREYYLEDFNSLRLKVTPDQPSFCKAIYDGDISFYVLPAEFNFRAVMPAFASDPVRIIHARAPESTLLRASKRVNGLCEPRVFLPHQLLGDKPIVADTRLLLRRIRKGFRYRLRNVFAKGRSRRT